MSDMLAIPFGVEDFRELIHKDFYYVDKSLFLKLIPGEKVALFTRPRYFGKTLTMSMFKYFFEMNYDNPLDTSKQQELFKNLAIYKYTEFCQKHMGQYPVIAITFKNINGETFKDAAVKVGECFEQTLIPIFGRLEHHSKLSNDEKEKISSYKNKITKLSSRKIINTVAEDLQDLTFVLNAISQYIYNAFDRRPIIIIDEYDVPLAKARGKYYKDMVYFIKNLLDITFKTNNFLEKGILTGCLRVTRESIFTGLNNISVYDCSNTEYTDLFGFTNEEVKQMLDYYNLSHKFGSIKEWYDGYQIGKSEIYNPFSVNSYVKQLLADKDSIPSCAWINSSGNDFLTEFINYLPNKELEDFEKLLEGNIVNKDVNVSLNYGDLDNHKVGSLWSMLYATGYLTKAGLSEGNKYTLRIPNKEVRQCFKEKIVSYFKDSPEYSNNGLALVDLLVNRKLTEITRLLNKLLPKYLGLRDVKANLEYTYHSFIDGLLASSGIDVDSQQEAGEGVPDISFIAHDVKKDEDIAIILELKRARASVSMEEKCEEAIRQCHDKKYYRSFQKDPSISHIYLYGVAFCNRACATLFEEVPLNKA